MDESSADAAALDEERRRQREVGGGQPEKFRELGRSRVANPELLGGASIVMDCRERQGKIEARTARSLRWFRGQGDDGRRCARAPELRGEREERRAAEGRAAAQVPGQQ
jgi:hypothetical protein